MLAAVTIEEVRVSAIVPFTTSARPNLDTASTIVTTRTAVFRRNGPNCPLGPPSVTKHPLWIRSGLPSHKSWFMVSAAEPSAPGAAAPSSDLDWLRIDASRAGAIIITGNRKTGSASPPGFLPLIWGASSRSGLPKLSATGRAQFFKFLMMHAVMRVSGVLEAVAVRRPPPQRSLVGVLEARTRL